VGLRTEVVDRFCCLEDVLGVNGNDDVAVTATIRCDCCPPF